MASYHPRINGSMLGLYANKEVVLVGRVEANDGVNVTLRTSDGLSVNVESEGLIDESASIVEVTGIALRNGLRAKSSTNFDSSFDLEKYNEAVLLIQAVPAPFHA